MKKISTLFIAIALFSIGAFAQSRRYNNDDPYNQPYQQQTYGDSYHDRNNNDWNDRRDRNDRHWRHSERFEKRNQFRDGCINDGVANDVIFRDRLYNNGNDRYPYRVHRRPGLRIVIGGVLKF